MGDLFKLLPIAGGSIDVIPHGDEPQEDLSEDGVPEDAAPEAGTAADVPGEGEGFDIDGQRYTVDQLKAALEALNNKSSWEKSLKQSEMGLADFKKTIEYVFGKPFAELTEDDMASLESFGVLERRLRRDPQFRQQWQETFGRLADTYEQAGATKVEAERAAAARIARAKAQGERPETVQADKGTIGRLDRMEQWATNRELRDLGNFIESTTAEAMKKVATDLEDFHPELRELVLNRMVSYDNGELLQMMYDGRLSQWVNDLATFYTKRFKSRDQARAKREEERNRKLAEEAERGKTGGPTPPLRGGPAAPAKDEILPRRGRGLKDFHKPMLDSPE